MKKERKSGAKAKKAATNRGQKRSNRLKATQKEKPIRKKAVADARKLLIHKEDIRFKEHMASLFGQK
jgi:hypothetical protein